MLIVEDNPILDGLLLETLQIEELYEVFHAPSGGSKQNILQTGAPMFSLLETIVLE
ncbi:hypothetical protein KSC_021700 [Ktedonobacter sp. SOSP1-52]|uniref:hypothetical protein n=1 Tax=Ktedonobacter sp. SOSP1-52 TaxID=2778366 RepID=UPI001915848A|nr:hypothetical protein [Ktedonobacter sp. SOSP1-52]GHO63278.1 hypothetical protein KSC_021700 [Ktedonobacter sp. SOSP1-52]